VLSLSKHESYLSVCLLGCFFADHLTVPLGVDAKRVRKEAWTVPHFVDDIINRWPTWGIQSGQITDPLRHFMVGAGCVSTHTEATDNFAVFVKRDPASEGDDPASDLPLILRQLLTVARGIWGRRGSSYSDQRVNAQAG